jgi:hypothetical protein
VHRLGQRHSIWLLHDNRFSHFAEVLVTGASPVALAQFSNVVVLLRTTCRLDEEAQRCGRIPDEADWRIASGDTKLSVRFTLKVQTS